MVTIVDRLRPLSEVGTVIACPEMTLLAGDHDPPIVVGAGEITVLTPMSFGYTLRGTPSDFGHALRSLRRIDRDPYDGTLRERLTVKTFDGADFMAGWTIPKVHVPESGAWIFTGEVEALSFHEDGDFDPGTEVAYLLPQQHRARIILRRFFPPAVGGGMPTKSLRVLGSEVVLTLDDDADLLIVRAPASDALIPCYAENWLGEPLRILFGQLIYPRFVLRQSDKWAMGWVRPSPQWMRDSDACSLWQSNDELIDADGFWESFRRLLAYVAGARDERGDPNFEANKLTELYVEVIQAARGSRWVWALTYASAVEALLRLLGLEGRARTDMDAKALTELTQAVDAFNAYIDAWEGDPRPKKPAKRAAGRLLRTSSVQALRQLVADGSVAKGEFDAWDRLRNRVMHGSLVSPYSTAEEDKLLLDLSRLFHSLTRRLLQDVDPDREGGASISEAE